MKSKTMQIQILVDNDSWILPYVQELSVLLTKDGHAASVIRAHAAISQGDVLFILGCIKKVPAPLLKLHQHNIVVHQSNLPHGRGFSPLTWQVLEGVNQIPVCLFEAEADIDTGPVYIRSTIDFKGHELLAELKDGQGKNTVALCHEFINTYPQVLDKAKFQQGPTNFYRRRTPEDSRLDVNKNISAQFDLLRVVDNDRYPAFFEMRGKKYKLRIEHAE